MGNILLAYWFSCLYNCCVDIHNVNNMTLFLLLTADFFPHQGLQEEKTKKENKLGDLQKNVNETKSKVKTYNSEFCIGSTGPDILRGNLI